MNKIAEILGDRESFWVWPYNLQDSFEEYVNTAHRAFLEMLRVIEKYLPELERARSGMGRPAYESEPFSRAFLGMNFFRIASIDTLKNCSQASVVAPLLLS